jgi:dopamine beta-monooxygenase
MLYLKLLLIVKFLFLVTCHNPHSMHMDSNMNTDNTENSTEEPGIYSMNIGLDNVQLPTKETFYMCKYFNVDELASSQTGLDTKTKYHAIEFKAHFNHLTGHHGVHHMVIFECPVNLSKEKIKTEAYECTNMVDDCNNFVVIALPGTDSYKFPTDAGFIWGSGDTKVILLQAHYHNPSAVSGDVSSAGFSVHYTPNLRKYNIGIMLLGVDLPFIRIPPRQTNYNTTSICDSECTSRMNGNVTVFGYMAHAHLTATSVSSEFRNSSGSHLIDLGEKDFNFSSQTLRFVEPINLQPGFSVTTTCVYDTTERDSVTYGGPGSSDEMCANLILFYPRENGIGNCMKSTTILKCLLNNHDY